MKCLYLFLIIVSAHSLLQEHEVWPSDWWRKGSLSWSEGFEDDLKMPSITPDQPDMSLILDQLWDHHFKRLYSALNNLDEFTSTLLNVIRSGLTSRFNRKQIRADVKQLRSAYAFYICQKFNKGYNYDPHRPSFCPNICDLNSRTSCPEYRLNNQAFKCHVTGFSVFRRERNCSCLDEEKVLDRRLKICLQKNAKPTREEHDMPFDLPINPWILIESYKHDMLLGFPHNYSHQDIIPDQSNWHKLKKIVSKNSYAKYFSDVRGTLFERVKKVYSRVAHIHNFNLRKTSPNGELRSEVKAEDYILGILLFACNYPMNIKEPDIKQVIDMCPSVCKEKYSCGINQICKSNKRGLYLSDKKCFCKNHYVRDNNNQCIYCNDWHEKEKVCNDNKVSDMSRNAVNVGMPRIKHEVIRVIPTVWSQWTEWSFCSHMCGNGFIMRTRYCKYNDKCKGEFVGKSSCDTYSIFCDYKIMSIGGSVVVIVIVILWYICFRYYIKNKAELKDEKHNKYMEGGIYGKRTNNSERHRLQTILDKHNAKKVKQQKDQEKSAEFVKVKKLKHLRSSL